MGNGYGFGQTQHLPVRQGLVIVLAQSITLFLFASTSLEHFLASHGLPTFPLVPVSSSQAVIGAILGISLFKGADIRYNVLGGISLGWVATPVFAGVIAFFLLFFVENVFDQQVSKQVHYRIDSVVVHELFHNGVQDDGLESMEGIVITNAMKIKHDLEEKTNLSEDEISKIMDLSLLGSWVIDPGVIADEVDSHWLSVGQMKALRSISGEQFDHSWQLFRALSETSDQWKLKPDTKVNKLANKELNKKRSYLERLFRVEDAFTYDE